MAYYIQCLHLLTTLPYIKEGRNGQCCWAYRYCKGITSTRLERFKYVQHYLSHSGDYEQSLHTVVSVHCLCHHRPASLSYSTWFCTLYGMYSLTFVAVTVVNLKVQFVLQYSIEYHTNTHKLVIST